MRQIVGKGPAHVVSRHRHAGFGEAVVGKRLERTLPVVGRVEVQPAGQQRVHAHHLGKDGSAQRVGVGVGIVTHRAVGQQVVARLGRGDVEDVGLALPACDVPLRVRAVVRLPGQDVAVSRYGTVIDGRTGREQDGGNHPNQFLVHILIFAYYSS